VPAMPQTTDLFETATLGLQWQWQANPGSGWFSLSERAGWLRLFPVCVPRGDFLKAPNLLLQKFPARSFSVETRLEIPAGQPQVCAGLIVSGEAFSALEVRRTAEGYVVTRRAVDLPMGTLAVAADSVTLCAEVENGGFVQMGVVMPDGRRHFIGPTFQAREGRWIGAKIGLFCLRTDALQPETGHADFSDFRFLP